MTFLKKHINNWMMLVLLLITPASSFAVSWHWTKWKQGYYTISGYVKDAATGEYAIGASVYIKELSKGTVTNQYGFYSITVKEGDYVLEASYVGYQDFSQKIHLDKDLRINISLQPKVVKAKEVVISGKKANDNITNNKMGTVTLNIKEIKTLPSFMGESDILKTIQLLPGVQSAGDGNSGFYVRGGGPDENLILLDGAQVYNASHLFGFFSVFNSDAIKDVTLIKGNMPANYGGRLSSVLDITMKEGNNRHMHVNGGIGLIASRLTVEGPIKKDTSSFIFSARRTYIDVFLRKPFIKPTSNFSGSSYYFYDLNGKVNYRLSDKDRLFLSGYYGQDVFNFSDHSGNFKVKIPWGNAIGTLRWNHLYNPKLFANYSAIFSSYRFQFAATESEFDFKLFSGITDWNAKADFNYFPNVRHNIKFGADYIFHTFIPSSVSAKAGDVTFNTGNIAKLYAHDAALYVNDDFDLTEKIKLNGGLRFSYFEQIGPFTRYNQTPLGQPTDTVYYKPGQKVAAYDGLEPRFSIRYEINKKSSIKAGYTQNFQYIHLASISAVSLPTDIWMPSTSLVKPEFATQYALGYYRNFYNNTYVTSIETYYKQMYHLIEYKDGAMPEDNIKSNPDNNFTFGNGLSYGVELFLKKSLGDFNGWIGYTLSWTTRTFPDLNNGKTFYAKYDRRHDISVALNYTINPRWTISSVFVYATGNALTLPVARYMIEGNVVNEYGARNSYRMAPYNRLDLSATYTPDRKKHLAKKRARRDAKLKAKGIDPTKVPEHNHKKWDTYQSSWTLSVYNVYDRYNPYFIYFDNSGSIDNGTLNIQAKQVSLFPILPSITWNFQF